MTARLCLARLWTLTLLLGTAHATPAAPPLLREGERELSLLLSTHYQHTTRVDEARGRFDYDCSGFLDYALRRVDPAAYRELPVSRPGSRRPLAQDFYALFSGLNTPSARWEAVPGPAALRPGDIVSWLKPPDNDSNNTGHVMLVRARPRPSGTRPDEWLIDVIDSTTTPHAQDSRPGGSTGLGSGTIGVIQDARGDAVAFRWRGGLSRMTEQTPIAFGRLRSGPLGKP